MRSAPPRSRARYANEAAKHRAVRVGVLTDVISPPNGALFSETNDNSVGILLTFGTAHVLLAGDAEKKGEEYMSSGSHTGPLTVISVQKHKTA